METKKRSMRKYNTFFISVSLSLFALIVAIMTKTPHFYICFIAMALCTIGDIILANFYGFKVYFPFPTFIAGGVVFMFGHLGYVIAFIARMNEYGYTYVNTGFKLALTFVVISYFVLIYFAKKKKGITLLAALLCALYAFFVGLDLCTAVSFCWSRGGWVWLRAFGAFCFFISDYLIGVDVLVGGPKYLLQQCIWGFYPVGQLLLLLPL